MIWEKPEGETLGPPTVMAGLLERALAAKPDSAVLHAKLGYLHLDRYDFAAAASSLEAALRLDPASAQVRLCLARCCNMLDRPETALQLLDGAPGAQHERAQALAALGDTEAAQDEFRAILADDPHHLQACRRLCRMLRKAGRIAELLETCEGLAARGACHAQLLYNWGWALALAGRHEEARRILVDPARVTEHTLRVPAGFADLAAFNAALAEELLTNPCRLSDFAPGDEATRGSSRVEHLFAGRRPELIALLLQLLQALVGDYVPAPRDGFDPWPRARPAAARLKAWGLLQRGGDYEDWHIHRGGWLSGVYYVRVPPSVTGEGRGPGCIEFGPPAGLARDMPGFLPGLRHVPREGTLLLAPSHYPHRTIPSGVPEDRISLAFDVVPRGTRRPDQPGA